MVTILQGLEPERFHRKQGFIQYERVTLEWSAALHYSTGDIVDYLGIKYTSLQNNNLNHLPNEEASTFWQVTADIDKFQLVYAQRVQSSVNLDNFGKSFIDNQRPVYTQIGDVIGSATVEIFDTADLYDTVNPATNLSTVSFWKESISKGHPPAITFLQTKKAEESSGNKFEREKWSGRIIVVEDEDSIEEDLYSVTLSIEMTNFLSSLRSAS